MDNENPRARLYYLFSTNQSPQGASFPLAALSSVVLEAVHDGGWPLWIGIAALLAASAVIAFLALRTAILLLQGRFLTAE